MLLLYILWHDWPIFMISGWKAGSTAMTQRPRDRFPSGSMLALPDPRKPNRANPPANFWRSLYIYSCLIWRSPVKFLEHWFISMLFNRTDIYYLNVTDCCFFKRKWFVEWILFTSSSWPGLLKFYFWIFYWSFFELFPTSDLVDWILSYIYIYN